MFNLTWLSNTTFVNKTPRVTWCLLMVLSLAFLFRTLWLSGHPEIEELLRFVPYNFMHAWSRPQGQMWLVAGLSLVTNIFLHDGRSLLHLFGNMLALFALGPAVEARLGGWRLFALFLLSGIAGSLCHALLHPDDHIPLVGASGAVFGVAAAYMVLWWREGRVFSLITLFEWIPVPLSLSAPVAVSLKVTSELASIAFPKEGDLAAHWVHIGGFLMGLAFGALYQFRILGRDIPLPSHVTVDVPDAWALVKYAGIRVSRLVGRI